MTAQRIGYSRVSTLDQNPDGQQDKLTAAGCDRIFVDHFTGTKASRPQWDLCRQTLREGDTLVITRLDRLGRSTKDLLAIASDLAERGVHLQATEQHIDTTTPEGRLFFTLIGAFAEFEHALMVARTKDGLAAARARGRVGGRKPALSAAQQREVRKLAAGARPIAEIAELFGVSRGTIYRVIERPSPASEPSTPIR